MTKPKQDQQDEFLTEGQRRQPGVVAEFWDFLKNHKRWWLTPIIIILLLIGFFIIATGTAIIPGIYIFF